jgi:hypothetical protein
MLALKTEPRREVATVNYLRKGWGRMQGWRATSGVHSSVMSGFDTGVMGVQQKQIILGKRRGPSAWPLP